MRKIFLFISALLYCVSTWATEGALSGRFTINAEGDQIVFSQGNLQYNASTQVWRFADDQLTALGTANANITETTYTGWLDLFGWGTGTNPTNYSANWQDYPKFNEWGENAISNGGNASSLWRTLTNKEWDYLFFKRANATSLFGLGQVNGIKGLILLPDDWTNPEGISFHTGISKGLVAKTDYYANTDGKNYKHNEYTSAQWTQMESAGAIFLPAAGYRWDNEVYMEDSDLDYMGYYWASTPYDNWEGYLLYFDGYELSPQNKNSRIYGQAVRLVQNANHSTRVETISHQSSCRKFIKNGQLCIERAGCIYNAQGVKLSE